MLSNKSVSSEKITSVENEKIITDAKEIAKVLNDFFSNLIKSLNFPQKNHNDWNFVNVRDPTLKSILKYHHHSSILGIEEKTKRVSVFIFNHISKEDSMKEIQGLDVSKASQLNYIPPKIIKENANIFSSST